jgi:hypothetical protein
MRSAYVSPRTITASGVIDKRASAKPPRVQFDAAALADPSVTAVRLEELSTRVDDIARTTPPPFLDFEDVSVTSGVQVMLEHRFGCRVRWYVVDWSGSAAPNLRKSTSTTSMLLVLDCGQTGTATIRVEPT